MNKFSSNIPRVITIAGSDSGGGAGIQADLKTFGANGVYGTSAITAITAQNTVGVQAILGVPLDVIEAQIDSVFTDIGTDAVKIGMLGNPEVVNLISKLLSQIDKVPIVLDPVMIAKSGDQLISDDSISNLKNNLIPLCSILTPNIPEAEVLSGIKISNRDDMIAASSNILKLGPKYLLLKGGHLTGDPVDILFEQEKGMILELPQKRIHTKNTHGTGCTFSSAIAAELAKDVDMKNSVINSQKYVYSAIKSSVEIGKGHGPLNHFFNI